ncbi:MAG: gamma-glutamyltransferase, partial [Myxococcales bacterium]|nr:gamma-glutamyltransferase [Myxococcales bacterium]
TFLDFREMAPSGATEDMFKDQKPLGGPISNPSQLGGLSSGVPGEPAGIDALLTRFGKVKRSVVTAPAIRYAEKGFEPRGEVAEIFSAFADQMRDDRVFRTWFDGKTNKLKPRITNPALGKSIRAFAAGGAKPFYEGAIAKAIVRENRAHGGLFTDADLKNYKVVDRKPLEGEYFGYRWVSSPPPSAGGYTMLASLALLERWIPEGDRKHTDEHIDHAFVESWKGPYLDRMQYLGDPDFADVPLAELGATSRIESRAAHFRPGVAMAPVIYAEPLPRETRPAKHPDNAGTSHLCVVDSEGNVASITTTVNLAFGARYTAAGIVLNDQMDDFAADVGKSNAFGLMGGAPNLPAPGKRPLSSMSPTIVFDANGPVLCVGGSGGSRIIAETEQVAFHTLVQGMPLGDAVRFPRVHHQASPDRTRVESKSMRGLTELAHLQYRGHSFEKSDHNAVVQAIQIVRGPSPTLIATSDPRKGGTPAGQ